MREQLQLARELLSQVPHLEYLRKRDPEWCMRLDIFLDHAPGADDLRSRSQTLDDVVRELSEEREEYDCLGPTYELLGKVIMRIERLRET